MLPLTPKMLVDSPNSIQNQRPFLLIQTTEQLVVNNLEHNFGNT
jgi:hypothetical protein